MSYLGNHHDHHEGSPVLEYGNLGPIMEDIPRSTSAPPSLEELQNAYATGNDDNPFVMIHEDDVSMKPFADIRLDEDYEEFYKHYAGEKKLPPPVENRQLYNLSPSAGALFHTPFAHVFESEVGYIPHHRSSHRRHSSMIDPQKLEERRMNSHRIEEDHVSGLSSAFTRMKFDPVQSSMENMPSFNGVNGNHQRRNESMIARQGSPDRFHASGSSRMNGYHPREAMPEKNMQDSRGYGPMGGSEQGFDEPHLEMSKSEPYGTQQRPRGRSASPYDVSGRSLSLTSKDALFENFEHEEGPPLDAYGRHMPSGFSPPNHGGDMYNPAAANSRSHPPHINPAEFEMAALKQAQRAQQLAAMQLQRQQQQQQEQLAQLEQDRLKAQLQQQQIMMMMFMQQQQQQQQDPRAAQAAQAAAAAAAAGGRYNPSPNGGGARGQRPGHKHGRTLGNFDSVLQQPAVPMPPPLQPMMGVCPFYLQGYCARGSSCHLMHSIPTMPNMPGGDRGLPPGRREFLPPQGDSWGGGGAYDMPPGGYPAQPGVQLRRKPAAEGGSHAVTIPVPVMDEELSPGSGRKDSPPGSSSSLSGSQTLKYNSLEDVEGRIFIIAKDQHGCRFLQRKFDEGGADDVAKIFAEIQGHVIELMTDPFGNYLIQKLLEVCTSEQRLDILKQVTDRGELITISLNMHGTRAVQKLIETIEGPLQIKMVIASLRPGVVALIKDLNGNHVVQRCLQKLSNADSQFIFDAAASHCIEIATHRHGCCVLQRCIDYSTGTQRERLVREIAANSLVLGQDPFGNYVVQYILDLNLDWAVIEVMERLQGQYAVLAQQKFSSNVVEKCLKLAGEDHRTRIIEEIISTPRFSQLLQDPFANYVFQSALTNSKGSLHSALVEAIRPHTQILKSSPYGKRILSRIHVRKP